MDLSLQTPKPPHYLSHYGEPPLESCLLDPETSRFGRDCIPSTATFQQLIPSTLKPTEAMNIHDVAREMDDFNNIKLILHENASLCCLHYFHIHLQISVNTKMFH